VVRATCYFVVGTPPRRVFSSDECPYTPSRQPYVPFPNQPPAHRRICIALPLPKRMMACINVWEPDAYDPNGIVVEDEGWVPADPNVAASGAYAHGHITNLDPDTTRRNIFLSIFGPEARNSVICQTNAQLHAAPVRASARSLTEPEFLAFLSVKLMMCITPARYLSDYWRAPSVSEPRGSAWVRSRFGYHRFSTLNSHLRAEQKTLFDSIVASSLRMRTPCSRVSFDESMILYLGDDCKFKVGRRYAVS